MYPVIYKQTCVSCMFNNPIIFHGTDWKDICDITNEEVENPKYCPDFVPRSPSFIIPTPEGVLTLWFDEDGNLRVLRDGTVQVDYNGEMWPMDDNQFLLDAVADKVTDYGTLQQFMEEHNVKSVIVSEDLTKRYKVFELL